MVKRRSFYTIFYFIFAFFFLLMMILSVSYFTLTLSQLRDGNRGFQPCRFYQSNDWTQHLIRGQYTAAEEVKTSSKVLIRNNRSIVSASEDAESKEEWIDLEAQSDRKHIYVAVNGYTVYNINDLDEKSRGLHVIVLNQYTAKVMASVVFDFYGGAENVDLVRFLDSLHHGRIVVFLIKDEGSNGFHAEARDAVKLFGSRLVHHLKFRDSWICIATKRSSWVAEDIGKYRGRNVWPGPLRSRISLQLEKKTLDFKTCFKDNEDKRSKFCEEYDGYEKVCDCNNHDALYKKPAPLIGNNISGFPIVIIASNRPRYLFRMLRKLMGVAGADPNATTVFVDGYYNETIAVAELFGLQVVVNDIECTRICRVQQHYKKSLTKTFDDFPHAKCAIIIEEDLEVADDIMDYFSQTYPLFESDPSIYCISAWNDQGYKHAVKDPSLLYRVETMPGLGWLLSRSLYKQELEPKWPGPRVQRHWDLWLRKNENRKGRECIIPDISRTYHFGAKGLNINLRYQTGYFKRRALNKNVGHKFDIQKVKKQNYESELKRLIGNAEVLNYTRTSCKNENDIVPDTEGKIYLLFIKMEKKNADVSWLKIAKCFRLWDLDVRNFHNGLIRFWIKQNQIIVIGFPASDYAHYKPEDILPVDIKGRQ